MRWQVITSVLTSALILTVPVPASAATGASFPTPLSTIDIPGCGPAGTLSSNATRVTGPGNPPLGTGSLRLDTGASPDWFGIRYDFAGAPASALNAFRFFHYEAPSANPDLLVALLVDRDGTGAHHDELDLVPLATNGVWQQVDMLTQTLVYNPDAAARAK